MRSFKKFKGSSDSLFSQSTVAKAIPDFKSNGRQSISAHERFFRETKNAFTQNFRHSPNNSLRNFRKAI